jgi:hypothetical protein
MSALGQKQTFALQKAMSALPPKASPYSIISIAQAMRACLR